MSIDTTTTTTTVTQTQLGTQLVVKDDVKKQTVGTFVTDVSIQPYIASRIVSFWGYNLRPKQRVHIFFDGVLVDEYCAPAVVPASIADTSDYHSIQKNGNYGDPIVTDTFGQVAGWFNIPEATFKTGDRVLTISDVDNIAKGSDAVTTTATATFTASNISVTKETVTLTTVNPQISTIPIKNQIVTSSATQSITIHPEFIGVVTGSFYEPIAQGLTINTPNGEAGVFATSLDIYFKQKSQFAERGVTVYLCETLNGYPNGSKVLPFSTVHLNYDQINVSTDSSIPTTFIFEAPVYLNNGLEYAFVVKPDAGDPDYWVYSAKLGDVDIQTGKQMYSQPVIGTAYYGATENTWTAIQNEYIKFELFRAKFDNNGGLGGNAYFVNSNTDYLTIQNLAYACTSYGILPGDIAFQATNSTISTVNTSVKGIVNSFDDVNSFVTISNSTSSFAPNTFVQIHRFANDSVMVSPGPNTTTLIAYANTGSLYDPKVNALVPQFATITPAGTSLSFSYKGASNAYALDSKEYNVNIGREVEFLDYERIVASKSNETVNMPGSKSMNIRAHLQTDSDFLSPVIDTVRKQQLIIANDVEPIEFIYDEFFNNGTAKSKYVSQVVTLAGGNDAEDLQVILSAFRPIGTDIQVWVKFLSGEDGESLTNKTWVPMLNTSSNFSNPANPSDLKEFVFTVPPYYGMIPLSGLISCNNTTGRTTVVGQTGTHFNAELKPGWYVNMLGTPSNQEVTRRITSITDNSHLTIDGQFNVEYTNQTLFLVPPTTTAWLSTNNAIQRSGTASASTTTNIVTGDGSTNFTGEFTVGSIIKLGADGDEQVVKSITSSHTLTVGTPWSATVSGATPYLVTPLGVSYLNSAGSLYSTFKRFQIKVILQTNDSSQVPQIKDIRALALQL